MTFYGFIGLGIGFVAGLLVNAYLLQDVSKERYLKDKNMRLKYGALNWGIALLGLVMGLAIGETR